MMTPTHHTIFHVYTQIGKKIRTSVQTEKVDIILGADAHELTAYYVEANCLQPLIIDLNQGETAEVKPGFRLLPGNLKKEGIVDYSKVFYEYEDLIISIPFQQHSQIEIIRQFGPQVNSMVGLKWEDGCIQLRHEIKGLNFYKSEDEVALEVAETKKEIYEWIERLNTQIRNLNENLKSDVFQWIQHRKEKLLEQKERHSALIKKINIPLRKKEDETINRIKLDKKPIIQRVKPSPTQMEDYIIDRKAVLDVVQLLDNYGRQLERTPATFKKSGEEDLRNIFLVGLNGVFEGKATGETFLNKGKTDIYLDIDKGKILVCECKIWGGKQLYSETIDQLLGYLTWRNNYGILITFVRTRSLTKALGEVKSSLPSHVSYKKGIEKVSDTHLISQHRLPTDGLKNVELHHLFYHLFINP